MRVIVLACVSILWVAGCSSGGTADDVASTGADAELDGAEGSEPVATSPVTETSPESATASTSEPAAGTTGPPFSTDGDPSSVDEVDEGDADGEVEEVEEVEESTSPAAGTSDAAGPVTEDDLAVFVAAAERTLGGTALEGTILDAPEIYVAIAQSACARFEAGDAFDVVASELLDTLDSGSNDDAILVGAVLGAATQTVCSGADIDFSS